MANTVTVANLQADLSLNTGNFSEGVNNAAGATDNLTTSILKADAVKMVLQGVADFAGKVAGIVKDAVGNFAEYEQLTGGVETLFGDSADIVMNYAENAFATAGMSANKYMETVTGFSAALLQGLDGDTAKAAKISDMALSDMADNANKMGSSMESIRTAYQGFSKQNYTMLDNLKLGYGGTKSEMERLLKDAQELSGVEYNIDNLADVYEAIHVIQEEMGITGTTAKEAATTIQGSEAMMKASWQNLLTSMVTGGEWFDDCIDNFIESVQTYVSNLLPAITAAMQGFAALIGALAPMLAEKLPAFVQEVLPSFVSAVSDIINGVLDALPEVLKALKGVLPELTKALNDLIPNLIDFILESIPLVIDAGITLLTSLVSGLADNIETIVPKLTQGMIDMVDQIKTILTDGSVDLGAAALALLSGLASALVTAVPSVLTQVTQMVQDLTASINMASGDGSIDFLTAATTILKNLVTGLMDSIPTLVPELTSAVAEFVTQFASLAAENTTSLANAAIDILSSLVTSLGDAGTISQVATDITAAVMAIIQALIDAIIGLDVVTFADACASIVTQLADGIVAAVTVITAKLPDLITKIVEWLTNPDNLTGLLSAALTIFGELVADVPAIIEALTTGLAGIVTGIYNYFKDNGDTILQGFKDGFAEIGTKMTEIWTEKIKPAFDDLGEKLKGWLTQFDWGQSLIDFVGGIGKTITGLWDNIKTAFTGENGFIGKVKSWFSEFDLSTIITNFIQKIKDAIEGAWDSFKQWFQDKISGLFSGIKVPSWLNPKNWFGGGNGNEGEEGAAEDSETLIDMPENMMTLDYGNLQPVPMDTLESYQALADAISTINTAIGGGEGAEGGGGLNTALTTTKTLMGELLTAATNLADYLAGSFVTSITALVNAMCQTSTDEEGNVNASGGNTLYTAMGWIKVLFEDILNASTLIAEQWIGQWIPASIAMRTESGHATGVLLRMTAVALVAAAAFAEMAAQIMAVVDAYSVLNSLFGGGGGGESGGTPVIAGAAAEGGPVVGGLTYLVGEEGPELFTPNRNGWITSNNDLMSGGGTEIHIVNQFNGDVIGDEESISGYVTKATEKAIQEAVYAAV